MTALLSRRGVVLLDCLHDSQHQLRQLMQRWEDRLTFESLAFAEAYREHRMTLICDLERAGHRYRAEFAALTDAERQILDDDVPAPSRHAAQADYGHDWDEELVLVADVECVDGVESVIPTLVRTHRVYDEVDKGLTGRILYFSILNGVYQFLPALRKGKGDKARGRDSGVGDDLVGNVIERRPEVVQGIPNQKRRLAGHRSDGLESKDVLAVSVTVHAKAIEVALEESAKDRLKIADVFVGPFDL